MSRTTWLRRISMYMATATMVSFGLTSAASAQTITNTGPGSQNHIQGTATNDCNITDNNHVSASNSSSQTASTGNAEDANNTGTGLTWSGWVGLNPSEAQTQGASYSSWMGGVTSWIAQHATGNGWNSSETNLTWMPSGTDWTSYDPMSWQSNGQSFGNWYNSVESYLDAQSTTWLLSWPADATGNFSGSTSGNAINTNSANFSITINNTARDTAPKNACGQSSFTLPPAGGGMGGGPATSPTSVAAASTATHVNGVTGGGGGYAPTGSSHAPSTYTTVTSPTAPLTTTTSSPVAAASTTNTTPPTGGSSGSPTSASVISNTGPGSTNSISSSTTNCSSVTNNNTVSVVNVSSQTASTGNASSSYNTSASGSGSGSGDAGNGNSTGISTDFSS